MTLSATSGTLAEFVTSLQYDHLPAEVVTKCKNMLIDTVGVSIAASVTGPVSRLVSLLGATNGSGDSALLGRPERRGLGDAVMINSTMAHLLDYDDTHLRTIIHPSATVVPAALGVGELLRSDGRQFLTAMAAGYEVAARLGLATRPAAISQLKRLPTGVWGAFGAAITAGKLLDLSTAQTEKALALCAMSTAIVAPGAKVHSVSWASHTGLMAAMTAAHDAFEPTVSVLEGTGSIHAAALGSDDFDPAEITSELGERWETLSICPKPYACCHSHQGFMDAAKQLRNVHGVTPEDILGVECVVPDFTWEHRLPPLEQRRRPQTSYEAKFSVPFGVALMLVRGTAGTADFSAKTLTDSDVLAMVDKITFRRDTDGWSRFPDYYSGWLEVETVDGAGIIERVPFNWGSERNPMATADYVEKFDATCSGLGLDDAWLGRVVATLLEVDKRDVHSTTSLLTRPAVNGCS